jgi:hypothetical protein
VKARLSDAEAAVMAATARELGTSPSAFIRMALLAAADGRLLLSPAQMDGFAAGVQELRAVGRLLNQIAREMASARLFERRGVDEDRIAAAVVMIEAAVRQVVELLPAGYGGLARVAGTDASDGARS